MTGFGRALLSFQDKNILAEVKALNSKFTEMRFKLPQPYKEREPELRRQVMDVVDRGKVDVLIEVYSQNSAEGFAFNKALFMKYFEELSSLQQELNVPPTDLFQSILRIPAVTGSGSSGVTDEEWEVVLQALQLALQNFLEFRLAEGGAMAADCHQRVHTILQLLDQIPPLEKARYDHLKTRLLQSLQDQVGAEKVDNNRYEQEILYFLEKMDITEEKVRLTQHCKYFLEELGHKEVQKGRKLSFISQEIGREINTIGSKANSSDIQRLVVQMKDELEKIKELVANVV